MEFYNRKVWTVLAWAMISPAAVGAVEFDSAFSSGMVIQRDAPVRLGGKGTAGGEVTVSIDASVKTARVSAGGVWSVEFPALSAGGPHVVKAAEGKSALVLDDVLAGDVWICSGQSNMQMGVHEVIGGKEAVERAASQTQIRLLTLPRTGAKEPGKSFDAKWRTASAESVKDFSAVAWFFALHLKEDPALARVPLGIINSSFGGTAIEAWMPAESLPAMPKEQVSASMFGIPAGALFNGMIAPLEGLGVKGAVWYQGEANAGHPQVYAKLLENLIGQWRAAFKQPALPFFVVQLPAFEGRMDGYDFSWLREAQATACAETKNAWLATSFDTTDGRDLHPVDKSEIGRRVALLARHEVYQSKIVASGPVFKKASVQGHTVRLTFDGADGLATRDGKAPSGFTLAGADGESRYAKATLDGAEVVLENDAISSPETVRYAWGAVPEGNLVNRSGLPVNPFRTDKLAPGRVAFQTLPVARTVEAPRYQLTTGVNGQIASLIVRGRQFLSNEPGGGTRIPDGFGSRNFGTADELGPRRLRNSDNSGSLEIVCADDSMEWILRNDRDQDMEFHIGLSPQVKVVSGQGSAAISRGEVKLEIQGIDRASGGDAPEAVVKIAPHSTVTLRLQVMP